MTGRRRRVSYWVGSIDRPGAATDGAAHFDVVFGWGWWIDLSGDICQPVGWYGPLRAWRGDADDVDDG